MRHIVNCPQLFLHNAPSCVLPVNIHIHPAAVAVTIWGRGCRRVRRASRNAVCDTLRIADQRLQILNPACCLRNFTVQIRNPGRLLAVKGLRCLFQIRCGIRFLQFAPYGAHTGIIFILIALQREVIHRFLALVHPVLGRLEAVLHVRDHGLVARKGIRVPAGHLTYDLRGDRASKKPLHIGEFQIRQLLLGGLKLVALRILQVIENLILLHLVPLLDRDAGNHPGFLHHHVVGIRGLHISRSPDLGRDASPLHILGRHLRQGIIHDRIRKKREHKHNRQEYDRRIFYPVSSFVCCIFIHDSILRTCFNPLFLPDR